MLGRFVKDVVHFCPVVLALRPVRLNGCLTREGDSERPLRSIVRIESARDGPEHVTDFRGRKRVEQIANVGSDQRGNGCLAFYATNACQRWVQCAIMAMPCYFAPSEIMGRGPLAAVDPVHRSCSQQRTVISPRVARSHAASSATNQYRRVLM